MTFIPNSMAVELVLRMFCPAPPIPLSFWTNSTPPSDSAREKRFNILVPECPLYVSFPNMDNNLFQLTEALKVRSIQ